MTQERIDGPSREGGMLRLDDSNLILENNGESYDKSDSIMKLRSSEAELEANPSINFDSTSDLNKFSDVLA